jgi:hypothetical protein
MALALAATAQLASAHPSDPSTLTLDLLVDRKGLRVIDAAAQAATYDQRPSESQRLIVATAVLDALGVSRDDSDINAAKSDRYHEVGFTVRLRQPFANGSARGRGRRSVRATSTDRSCRLGTPEAGGVPGR